MSITWIISRGALGARSLGYRLDAQHSPADVEASFFASFGTIGRAAAAWARASADGRAPGVLPPLGAIRWVLRENDFVDEPEAPPTLELVDTGTDERVRCSLAAFELANEELDELGLIRAMRIGDSVTLNAGGACPPVRVSRVE